MTLVHGGLRWLHVSDDLVVFLRETASDRVLVATSRAAARATIDGKTFGFTKFSPIYGNSHAADSDTLEIDFSGPDFAMWSV